MFNWYGTYQLSIIRACILLKVSYSYMSAILFRAISTTFAPVWVYSFSNRWLNYETNTSKMTCFIADVSQLYRSTWFAFREMSFLMDKSSERERQIRVRYLTRLKFTSLYYPYCWGIGLPSLGGRLGISPSR